MKETVFEKEMKKRSKKVSDGGITYTNLDIEISRARHYEHLVNLQTEVHLKTIEMLEKILSFLNYQEESKQ